MVIVDIPKHMRGHDDDADGDEASPPGSPFSHEADIVDPPPDFDYSEWSQSGSAARVEEDGRIGVSLNLNKARSDLPAEFATLVDEFGVDHGNWRGCPPLCIVIMIVGSRGDVQPYVALAKRLHRSGHRVRIASHATFRDFVQGQGLEFFDIGGDPHDLMSYMVKNPGLIPGFTSLTNGDVRKKRTMLAEMMKGCWHSCTAPDQQTGRIFIADAIISNPPAFAHVHCAEALGIPLHMSFTMPWSATRSFPHPLVNIKATNAGERLTNYLSYALADTMTWQGLGDIVNKLRNKTMGLPSLSLSTGPDILDHLKVPWTYCMSPALVPKPADWSNHIDVVGFYFLDLATSYTPPPDLVTFLAAGPAPVYIGFGSVVVDDPVEMTRVIFEATEQAGVRVLLSAGWSGLGDVQVPPHIFLLGNVPHDWLFAEGRVDAVVHHGGAGTTAIGLAKGRPTVIVPFFGDQQFWGDMIHRSGAGPKPIPKKKFTVKRLAEAIEYAVSPQAKEAAAGIAEKIRNEDGIQAGVDSFLRHLPLLNMRCDLDPSRLAVWWSTQHCMKLSAFSAQVLLSEKRIDMEHLDLHRTKEYDPYEGFADPIAGPSVPIISPVLGVVHTTAAIPRGIVRLLQHGVQTVASARESQLGYHNQPRNVREPVSAEGGRMLLGGILNVHRGLAGVVTRPVSDIVGLLSAPLQSFYRSFRLRGGEKHQSDRRVARIIQGVEEMRVSTPEQRNAVLQRFAVESSAQKVEERRQIMLSAAQRELDRRVRRGPSRLDPTSIGSAFASLTSSDAGPSSRPDTGRHRERGDDAQYRRDLK